MTHPFTKSGTRIVGLLDKSEDKLHLELEKLQSAILARERRALTTPIHNDSDFRDRLTQIKRAYKQSAFDSYLATATRELQKYLKRVEPEETYDYWKSRNLLYELNEVFTISPEIKEQTANDAQKTVEELRSRSIRWDKNTPVSNGERKILREKVLFCACCGNELRRRGETKKALNLFEFLLDFITNKLKTSVFPCYSTRATLCYYIGATLRTLEHHRRAEAMFSEALNLLYARGKRLGSLDHLYVSRKQAIVVGLGFGLTNMTRGFLDRAEHALSTARSMLASVADPSVSCYVELLYATVLRCRAGSNQAKLEDVISQLKETRRTFSDPRFQARTCWELALAMTILGDVDGAQKHLNTVAKYADASKNSKWLVNVQILKSRICQKQRKIEEAIAFAEDAVDTAKSPDCNSVLPLVDAYITRGEAFLLKADITKSEASYKEARENFECALSSILETRGGTIKFDYLSNPKIAGVCTLRIAECYVRIGKQLAAQKQFAIWSQLAPHVEHEWVRELAVRVRAEIDRLAMDFTISAQDSQNWNYAASVARLRQWLLTRSLRKTNQNYSEAAKLLGVQRTTLYQWQAHEDNAKSRS